MSINISAITVYSNERGTAIVRVDTDQGVAGYGECSGMYPAVAVDIIKRIIEPAVIGMSIFDINSITEKAFKSRYKIYGQLLAMSFSGVELALWDAQGKALGQPVYNLLGGLYRNKVEYYASSMSRDLSPAEEAEKVVSPVREFGFKALKIKVGSRMGHLGGKIVDNKNDAEKVRLVREAVGPDIVLMLDGNSSFTWFQALQFYDLIQKYNIAIFEEPCPFTDIESHAKLSEYLGIPINLGEQEWDIYQIKRMIETGACQILAIDASKCGGLTTMRKASALCEAYGLLQAPHNTSHRINLYATMHFAAATPVCACYQEYSIENPSNTDGLILDALHPRDGGISVPDAPGFGFTLDEERMKSTLKIN